MTSELKVNCGLNSEDNNYRPKVHKYYALLLVSKGFIKTKVRKVVPGFDDV